jgi:amino-acid N-acetyltransferase
LLLADLSYTYMSAIQMNIEPLASLDEILPVLTGCNLPIADIAVSSPPQFFGFRVAGAVVAVVGLEHFQSNGLLRSLAVSPGHRGRGFAKELVSFVESFAVSRGVESLFLLTNTADAFFIKLEYCPISRQEAPHAIQAIPQFLGLCPSSSAFLFKRIGRTHSAVHADTAPAALRL